jgi:hypothetical protein
MQHLSMTGCMTGDTAIGRLAAMQPLQASAQCQHHGRAAASTMQGGTRGVGVTPSIGLCSGGAVRAISWQPLRTGGCALQERAMLMLHWEVIKLCGDQNAIPLLLTRYVGGDLELSSSAAE